VQPKSSSGRLALGLRTSAFDFGGKNQWGNGDIDLRDPISHRAQKRELRPLLQGCNSLRASDSDITIRAHTWPERGIRSRPYARDQEKKNNRNTKTKRQQQKEKGSSGR